MVLKVTFNNISYHGGQFNWWKKQEYQNKPLTCHQSLTNFITQCCIEYTSLERHLNSQR